MKQMTIKNGMKLLSKYNIPARLYIEFENESGINHVNRKNNTLWICCNDNRCYKYYIKENELFYYAVLETHNGISLYITNDSYINRFTIMSRLLNCDGCGAILHGNKSFKNMTTGELDWYASQFLNDPRKYV